MTAGTDSSTRKCRTATSTAACTGFQLWANLPSSLKMTAPATRRSSREYQGDEDDGTKVRVICGGSGASAVRWTTWPPSRSTSTCGFHRIGADTAIETTRHAFAYVFAGSGRFCNASGPSRADRGSGVADVSLPEEADNRSLVVFDRGDEVTVAGRRAGIRFLLVSASRSRNRSRVRSIVMNTREELRRRSRNSRRARSSSTGERRRVRAASPFDARIGDAEAVTLGVALRR